MAPLPLVALGSQGMRVSPQGLGCMGMSAFYGPLKSEDENMELIRKAIELGVTLLDTSDVYGPHTNELLIGKAIKGLRHKVQLSTKFGISMDVNKPTEAVIRGDPEYVRSCCEASLERLGVEHIDLYYQHRVDSKVPIEITMGELKKLVEEGKVKYVGLSEASAADIRRAHAVHPITAVQVEYSLWTREVDEDIIPTCRELGIGIVSYSPLGRGFLSGKNSSDFVGNDVRKIHPRFSSENFSENKKLYEKLKSVGEKKKCTPGQLSLAWVQHKGAVPIPGTTKWENLQENFGSLSIRLTAEEIKELEEAVPLDEVKGERHFHLKNTWRYTNSLSLSQWTGSRQS